MDSSHWCTIVWTSAGSPDRRVTRTLTSASERRGPDVAVTSTASEQLVRVAASGEFDLVSVPVLDAAVSEIYERTSRPDRFLLDLTGVTFLDASALRTLERVDRAVREHGGHLTVAAPTAHEPVRLLDLAVQRGWLPAAFWPSPPTGQVA